MFEYKPGVNNENIHLYLQPIEVELRHRYLEIVKGHGNGLWAYERLEWEVYTRDRHVYEAMNEDEKFVLNMYMKNLKCLYK